MKFRARLLLLIATLVMATAGAFLLVVNRSAEREATRTIGEEFARASRLFPQLVRQRTGQAAATAALLGSDYAFKRALADADRPTLLSNLRSLLDRTDAHTVAALDAEGIVLAARDRSSWIPTEDVFLPMVQAADEAGADRAEGYLSADGEAHAVVFSPVLAPDLVAWIGIGYRIDNAFARRLALYADVDVAFVDAGGRVVASSLATPAAGLPPAAVEQGLVSLEGERHLCAVPELPGLATAGLRAVLLASLDRQLEPTRRLADRLLLTFTVLMLLAIAASAWFARSLARPVQTLAEHTRVIAGGNYVARLDLRRRDELGDLAEAFNSMSEGLAERDRVRDLLDKNVSPEVARKLLHEGSALGGEEREVTVLFADLRGFTTLAENMPPVRLVSLLNRYLDRMSREIEREGGTIDKFIGDEIMALFGAPLPQPDSAERAARAALAMRRSLASFNSELAREGLPPLGFGIGINTASVVAGNIGSSRRQNYSVIGDGVNLAARLQGLTRVAAHRTDILLSSSTRERLGGWFLARDIGEVDVRGRQGRVRAYALDDAQDAPPTT